MILLMLATLVAVDRSPNQPVVVSSLTTQQMLGFCRGKDDDPTADFCTGYILGAFDSLSLSREICPSPDRASNIEVVATVRKYLRAHAKKTGTGAPMFVVRDALRDAYPCTRS